MRKDYSRAGFIEFYSAMDPDTRPCPDNLCPIAVYMGWDYENHPGPNGNAAQLDPDVAANVDGYLWDRLTARDIVDIARNLG